MQPLKKVQLLVFERMIEFQRGTMQSELAFITSQIAKFLLKDVFLIVIFVFPLAPIHTAARRFFALTLQTNIAITLALALFLSLFLFMGISKIQSLQQKFKYIIRLLVPWLDIFSLLVIAVNIQLLLVNLRENVALAGLNLVSVVSISVIQIFYNLFHFTKEPRSNNLFKKRQSQVISFCNMVTLATTYYLSAAFFPAMALPAPQPLAFSLLQLLTSLLKLKHRVFLQYYLSPFSQSVSSLFYFVELYLSLLVVLIHAFQPEVLSQNLPLLLGLMTLLSYSALHAYLLRRNAAMYLSSAAELKDEDQAMLYLDRLCELITKVENEEEDVILVSLKKKHVLGCRAVECFCRREGSELGEFVREHIRTELLAIAELFHASPSVLISILYFRMVVFKYYPEILAKLNGYGSHFSLSLTQRYYRYCLTQYVARFIRKKNYEIEAVDSEHMFRLEELRAEVEGLLRAEIEVRGRKWKYLSRGLCRVGELEHSCNQSLAHVARLMQVFHAHRAVFRKSKEFNLLFLFYFVKVSFLSSGKEVRENLKELHFGYKEDELYSLKEFRKFIYHKRSCVIETVVDTKVMGVVSAASRNVEEMFGFPQGKIIGASINSLMPQFMAEEHEVILAEWASSGTWRTIGKLKEIYCIHKEQYCFSALLYLKIYVKDNTMHFITNIFKLNENDFLVANPSLKLEGLGRRFLKLLGDPAKRMPLDVLVEHEQGLLREESFSEGKVYRKIFLSLRGLEDEVDGYLESINMKFDEEERRGINRAFHERLRAACQEKYFVEFSIKRYRMRSVGFLVVGLREARRIDRLQSIKSLERHPTYLHAQKAEEEDLEFEGVESRESSLDREEEEDVLVEHNANSSMTSMAEKENYPLSKTIEKFIAFLERPAGIRDARLSSFNAVMVVLLGALAAIGFVSLSVYRQVLLEIEGVFFADGAQSDVMQTTEIAYAYTYMLRAQLLTNASAAEFASTLRSARLASSYVYALRREDFAGLVRNATALTRERLYAYVQQPTTWSLHGQPQEVLTHQFLENMHYLTQRIVRELEGLERQDSTAINDTFFRELFANFPEMKRLNEFFLEDYGRKAGEQHAVLWWLTVGSMGAFLGLSAALGVAVERYFRFRFEQLARSFAFFTYVPAHFFEKMRDYYAQLVAGVVEREQLRDVDAHEEELFAIDTYGLFHTDAGRGGLTSKIRFINYESYYKWLFILALFLLANAIHYLASAQVRGFFPVSEAVIAEVNDLMRSENQMLEGYFELRAAYALAPSQLINQSLYDHLAGTLNHSQERFNHFANRLTSIFSAYDPAYEASFVKVLVANVCALGAPFLTPFENEKCLQELPLNILDGGILIAMNFFQKNLVRALEDLRAVYITGEDSFSGDYFRQTAFVELDRMLVYMFKVYQQTQAVVFRSYMVAIDSITDNYLRTTVGLAAFFFLLLLAWLRSIPAQKRALSFLYGHLLLVPFMILRANSRIAATLKDSIEYAD